ncbi:zinc finger protein 609 isoform X2 [Erinaceus europaeus]|nr:zinc finger protein 609 isoform X2 [Erinaceus europaeus]XP_060030305.1 zinc finger protein 609 isoform X2 [Erinaceus europaeus]
MSLSSSGASGGKGVDANPVETYDSGDEWDIGVGNLIIDLDADLEKDQQKLEMSGSKEVGLPAPNAVATLPDNIKFVTPVPGPQGKEGKSKSKRSKSGKDAGKPPPGASLFTPGGEGAQGKKEAQGRSGDGPGAGGLVAAMAPKASEKVAKASRGVAGAKKEKEGGPAKGKKERSEGPGACATTEKEPGVLQPVALGGRGGPYDGGTGVDVGPTEPLGSIAIEPGTALNPLGAKPEPEEGAGECRPIKKVKSEKMESPVAAPAVLPLHLLVPVVSADIASPCEQIMVRTRSVGVNTCDVALATEPECLGPCEPGTSVNLEGIVWQETEDGMLVVNVTWRNKTYVGTLLDCTRHAWAPPRFCDSPTSDLEMRNGRGRGKRVRPGSNTPVSEATVVAPEGKGGGGSGSGGGGGGSKTRAGGSSKGRRGSQTSAEQRPGAAGGEDAKASPSAAGKRKSKPLSDLELTSSSEDSKGGKRVRTSSLGSAGGLGGAGGAKAEPPQPDRSCASPVLIDCPHPNCNKKYKHINGLKYHQAHAHTDEDGKAEADGDSEVGEEPGLPMAAEPPKGPLSPARSATPKARLAEPHSPSPSGKFGAKGLCKKKPGTAADGEPDPGALSNDGSDDGPLAADETSQDAFDVAAAASGDRDRCRKAGGPKPDKAAAAKGLKPARPIAPALPPQQPVYTLQAAAFAGAAPPGSLGATAMVQAVPSSPQLKPIQPKPTVLGEPFSVNPALTPAKDKKKKDKKKKEPPREPEGGPLTPGKAGGRPEEGRSPFREAPGGGGDGPKGDGLLNGAADPHQSRLASIKAEADKVYSFSDNAPSPSIGGAAIRLDGAQPTAPPLAPLHVVTQNGAEASGTAKTSSPAYSDISDAGEDGEARVDGGAKAREPDGAAKEGAKKALFPPQPPGKEAPYYPGFESYYPPGSYAQVSPGALNPAAAAATAEGPALKAKKDEEPEGPGGGCEAKTKGEGCEDKRTELGGPSPQPSVIQQRPGVYMQSLYYNQYAYVPPYSYSEQAYHAHLLPRPPYDDPQKRPGPDRKDEWKPRPAGPPTLTKAPSLTDLVAKAAPGKPREPGATAAEPTKSVIIPKLDEAAAKLPGQAPDGPKGNKLGDAGHLGKEVPEPKTGAECSRQAEVDPILWYRQEAEPRMWTYVYPAKYADVKAEDERWKEEQRERKLKEERARAGKDPVGPKEDGGKDSGDGKLPGAAGEEARLGAKEPRPGTHVPVSSPLGQHQAYLPYVHGYSYSQAYDPSHPSYRGVPAVMMQNYPGSYLPSSYSFSPYGSKVSGSEDPDKARVSPSVSCKSGSESKALDILQQHASHYKSKSPTISDKTPQERDRAGCGGTGSGGGCSSVAAAGGADRSGDRPRTSPSQRLMSTHHHHHHLGYSLLPAQYNLPYAAGLSSTAIVASQQGSAPSLYPPPRR